MRAVKILFLLITILTASPVKAEAEKYYTPPTQFSAAFQIMDMGFANLFGLFRTATAGFDFDGSSKTISHLKVAIEANSLTAANGDGVNALGQLLETRRYPEISFMATSPATFKDDKVDVAGTLTAHGVSKPFTMQATLNHVGNSPRGGGMWSSEGPAVGLSLRGSFKRAEFGMGDPPEMPGRFGDSLTLMLDMQAIRQ